MAKNEEVNPSTAEAETVPLDGAKVEAEPATAAPVVTGAAPRSKRGLLVGGLIGAALLWSALAFGGGFVAGSQFGDEILPTSSPDTADDSPLRPGDGRGPGGFRPQFGNGDRPGWHHDHPGNTNGSGTSDSDTSDSDTSDSDTSDSDTE